MPFKADIAIRINTYLGDRLLYRVLHKRESRREWGGWAEEDVVMEEEEEEEEEEE